MPIILKETDGRIRSYLNRINLDLVLDNLNLTSEEDKDYTSNCHHLLLYELAKCFDKPRILELGTGEGSLTITLAIACMENGGKITTVDINNLTSLIQSKLKKLHLEMLENFIEIINCDDRDEKVIECLSKNDYDLIFIDTTKEYLQTLAELIIYSLSLSKNGLLVIHDTEHKGCMEAINEFLDDNKNFKIVLKREFGKADPVILKRIGG